MSTPDPRGWFGELRSALARAPSERAWRALCEVLERGDAARLEAEQLPYVLSCLSRWPDALKIAPARWVEARLAGSPAPWLAIAMTLDLSEQRLDVAELDALVSTPALHHVRGLVLSRTPLSEAQARALARAPWRLRRLELTHASVTDAAARALSQAAWWPHLVEIDLSHNPLGSQGLCAMLTRCTALRALALSGVTLDPATASALGQTPWSLRRLMLREARLGPEALLALLARVDALDTLCLRLPAGAGALIEALCARPGGAVALDVRASRLDAGALQALAHAPWLDQLASLTLSENPLSDAGARELAAWSGAVSLREVSLSRCALTACGARALARAPWLHQLHTLDLSGNDLDGPGLEALAHGLSGAPLRALCLNLGRGGVRGPQALSSASLPQLRLLTATLGCCEDDAVAALARAPWIAQLESLRLSGRGLSAAGAQALASAPAGALRQLWVHGAALGDEGVEALVRAPWIGALDVLGLERAQIGSRGAAALAGCEALTRLRELHLGGNQIGPQGAVALRDGARWSRLQALDLSHNALGDAGVSALTDAPWVATLQKLRLRFNQISSEGIIALARGALDELEELLLEGNQIDDRGGEALASASRLSRLRWLELGDNVLRARGMIALLRPPGLPWLEQLNLVRNRLTPHDAPEVAALMWATSLRRVSLWWNSLGAEGRAILEHTRHSANRRKLVLALTS